MQDAVQPSELQSRPKIISILWDDNGFFTAPEKIEVWIGDKSTYWRDWNHWCTTHHDTSHQPNWQHFERLPDEASYHRIIQYGVSEGGIGGNCPLKNPERLSSYIVHKLSGFSRGAGWRIWPLLVIAHHKEVRNLAFEQQSSQSSLSQKYLVFPFTTSLAAAPVLFETKLFRGTLTSYQPHSVCEKGVPPSHTQMTRRGLSHTRPCPSHCSWAAPWRRPDRMFRDLSVPEDSKESLVLVYMKRAWAQTTSRPPYIRLVLYS
uniref:Uncharacterized protein n=1 Tax=Timema cristinae TaxID=61476 RepID=A0A7R9H6A9_TIMCR|nr:unnamed protein product [Timema cristinae]